MTDPDEDFVEVYDDSGREDLQKNDEISPQEEAFMKGYDESAEEEDDESEDKEYEKAFEEE